MTLFAKADQDIRALTAALDALLALYGEPEPKPDMTMEEIADRLHELAAARRGMIEQRGGTRIDEIVDDFAAIQFPDHEARLLALAYRDQRCKLIDAQAENERLREAPPPRRARDAQGEAVDPETG